MENKLLISYIIPCYNVEETMLRECINSILSLPFRQDEFEVIIIDDGSELCYSNIESEYLSSVKFIKQENKGVSAARNHGISLSRGKYIHFIDADDSILPDAYSNVIQLIRKELYDIITIDFTTKANFTTDNSNQHLEILNGKEMLAHKNIKSSVWSYIIKKELIGNTKFDETLSYAEDDDFVTHILYSAQSVATTQIVAYFYRQHNNSLIFRSEQINLEKRLNDIYYVIVKLNNMAKGVSKYNSRGLLRRVAQLTMNYLYLIIYITRSYEILSKRIKELKSEKLFPLPMRFYTTKYYGFALLSRFKLGRFILLNLIPYKNKEL